MFILFDASLIQDLENQDEQYKNDLMVLLRDATNAICHKNHYISTMQSVVAQKLSQFALGKQERTIANAFDYIYRNYSIINSIVNSLNYIVIIGKYEEEFEFLERQIKINYTYALEQHFWDETFLIPENIDDDKYIKKIVDYEKQKIPELCNIDYCYRKEQGGGNNNINQTFLARLNEHSFVLAILDTDKRSPDSEFGSTAKNFESDEDIIKYKNYFYYIPNIHEIENLFSSDGFMELSQYSDVARNKIREIEMLPIPFSGLFRAFLDIKKGYTYKTLDNDYLRNLFEVDYSLISCARGSCPCKEKGCDKDKLLESGERSYLRDIFNNPKLDEKFDFAVNNLIPEIKSEWERIFRIFITACSRNDEKIIGVN